VLFWRAAWVHLGIRMIGCSLLPAREDVFQITLNQREQVVLRIM